MRTVGMGTKHADFAIGVGQALYDLSIRHDMPIDEGVAVVLQVLANVAIQSGIPHADFVNTALQNINERYGDGKALN